VSAKYNQEQVGQSGRAKQLTTDYRSAMQIVKIRLMSVEGLLNSTNYSGHRFAIVNMELVYLQLRLVVEQIYLSALIAQKETLKKTWRRYNRENSLAKLTKNIDVSHADFLPYPFKPQIENSEGVKQLEFIEMPLGLSDLKQLYHRSGDVLHEKNPYSLSLEERDTKCVHLRTEAIEYGRKLWALTSHHYRALHLDDGSKVNLMSVFPDNSTQTVLTMHLVEGVE